MVHDGEFHRSPGGQGGQDVAIGADNRLALLVGGGYIIDIGETPGFAVAFSNMPDAVRVDGVHGDGFLNTPGYGKTDGFASVGIVQGFNQSLRSPFCQGLHSGGCGR